MGWFKKLFGGDEVTDRVAPAAASPSTSISDMPASNMPTAAHSIADFAGECVDLVHRQWSDATTNVMVSADGSLSRVEWSLADGRSGAIMLSRYWQRLQAGESPDDVFASITAVLNGVDEAEERRSAIDLDHVLPLFKTRLWQEAVGQQLAATFANAPTSADLPLIRPTGHKDIILTYVEDRPETMGHISQRACDDAGLSIDALHARALENLARIYLSQLVLDGKGGRYVARLDGNYDVSMLLMFDQWRDGLELHGHPVIAIPARNEVLICGAGDPDAVAGMAEMAVATVEESPYALTAELLYWQPGLLDPLAVH